MSSQPHEDIIVDQSLEDLLPIVITEYDAISRKGIQSSFLARDLVRMYDKITFYKHNSTELDLNQYNNNNTSTNNNIESANDVINTNGHDENCLKNSSSNNADEALVEIIEEHGNNGLSVNGGGSDACAIGDDNLVVHVEEPSKNGTTTTAATVDAEQTPTIVAGSSASNNDTKQETKTPTEPTGDSSTIVTTPSKEKSDVSVTSPSATVTSPSKDKKEIEIILLPSTNQQPEKIDHQRITDYVYNEFEGNEFTRLAHNNSAMDDPDRSDQIFTDILNLLSKTFAIKQSAPCNTILSLKDFKDIVVSKSVPNYVSSLLEGKYGDGHPVVKYLTLVDQAFVVSLLGHFAEALFFTKIPIRFKDIRGTWRIDVRLYQDKISMVHRRTEQMLKPLGNTMLKNLFQFSWQVEIVYDSYSLEQIGSVHVSLLEIDWASYDESLGMNQKQKDEIQKLFIRMFSKSKADNKLPIKISMIDISMKHVRLLVKELRQQSKKLIKPNSETSSDNKSWFSSIFTSPESEDDPFSFVSSSKKK